MGTYTYSQFKAWLKSPRFGNSDSFDSFYGTWVNAAYNMLCNRSVIEGGGFELPQLNTTSSATTVDGTGYVSVPTDCLAILEVYDATNKARLDWESYPSYISHTDRATSTAEGKPSYWTRSGAYIYLYPTPDAAYTLTISYRKRPAALAGESDVTIIGAEWDDVILELAHFVGRNWAGEQEKAEYSRKLADVMIANIAGVYKKEERARREKLHPETTMTSRDSY
jgi:hypothetical protein